MHPRKLTLPQRRAVHAIVARIVVDAKAIWGASKRLLKGGHAPAPSNRRRAARRPPLDEGDVTDRGVFVIARLSRRMAGRSIFSFIHIYAHNMKSLLRTPQFRQAVSAKILTQ
jgi:hypothetical protein